MQNEKKIQCCPRTLTLSDKERSRACASGWDWNLEYSYMGQLLCIHTIFLGAKWNPEPWTKE